MMSISMNFKAWIELGEVNSPAGQKEISQSHTRYREATRVIT